MIMAATKLKLGFVILTVIGCVSSVPGAVAQTSREPSAKRPASASATQSAAGDDRDLVLTHVAGIVRDADRKPITGALVSITGTYGYYATRANSAGTGRGVTDTDGQYRLSFYTKPGGSVELLGVSAEAKGFVAARVQFDDVRPVMKPGATTEFNFKLSRGEVLAGVVVVPERLRDRVLGIKRSEEEHALRISNRSFSQLLPTQPGGAFEFWVPKGVYKLELMVDLDSFIVLRENVTSGTRDLKLEKADPPVAREVLERAFDALWLDMARNYSYFELKKIDWDGLKTKYRDKAVGAGRLPRFVDVLGEMLGELRDGHVRFIEPGDAIVNYWPQIRRPNGNNQAVENSLKDADWAGNGFARVGTTKADGFGVIRITRQSRADKDGVNKVTEFIRAHSDATGFIVDLRGADGGNELLARDIARTFCAKSTVYAKSKYRDGPRPTDFGPVYDRELEPSEKPFTKPVVCILGPGCVSSGEGLAQMLVCLPNVTSVGLPTRGSSGNPKTFKLPGLDVTVLYSRWVDMMPDGQPIEGRGIEPQIKVDMPDSAFEKTDPIWEKAVETLRARIKEG
jgi:hypothetical protein